MNRKKRFYDIKSLIHTFILILLFLTTSQSFQQDYSQSIIQTNKQIVDNLEIINNYSIHIESLDVAVKDSLIYLVRENDFIYYNLENSNVEFLGVIENKYQAEKTFYVLNQIEIYGNYMYLLGDMGYESHQSSFYIAEILDNYTIDLLGTYKFNASNGPLIHYVTQNLKIEENVAFIGTTWYNTTQSEQCIFHTNIIDISNKSNPIPIGNYTDTGVCSDLYINNDLIFLAINDQRVFNETDYSRYYLGENKLIVLDISNKSQPIEVVQLNLSSRPCSIAVQDNNLFLSFYNSGFEIYNIEDIFNPVLFVSTNIESRKIVLKDNLAYVLENESLTIFDTTTIVNLKKIGEKKVNYRGENGRFHDCIVENNLVFAVRHVDYYGSFVIFDCTNTKKPKVIFPEVDGDALRNEILLIIFGYIISPVVIFSLLALAIRLLLKKKKKNTVINGKVN